MAKHIKDLKLPDLPAHPLKPMEACHVAQVHALLSVDLAKYVTTVLFLNACIVIILYIIIHLHIKIDMLNGTHFSSLMICHCIIVLLHCIIAIAMPVTCLIAPILCFFRRRIIVMMIESTWIRWHYCTRVSFIHSLCCYYCWELSITIVIEI